MDIVELGDSPWWPLTTVVTTTQTAIRHQQHRAEQGCGADRGLESRAGDQICDRAAMSRGDTKWKRWDGSGAGWLIKWNVCGVGGTV
jgi:hypothetical protein